MEVINLTMTAKPMRPISPLEIDNGGEQDRERCRKVEAHTLVQTLSAMSYRGGGRWEMGENEELGVDNHRIMITWA